MIMKGVDDMKNVLTKIPAVIGMILTLICIFYLLKAYAYSYFPDYFDDGSNIYDPEMTAWGAGLFSIIVSVFSLIFYGIDAVFSVVRAIRKDNTTLNIIIVALFVVCLILDVWVISSYLRNYKTIVWFISYFSLFIIELISIIRCFVRKNQKTETSSII